MWQPSKGAFRAGYMDSAWDYDTNLGNISVAFGRETRARGNYSFAGGYGSYANSFAEYAIGRYSLGGGAGTAWQDTGADVVFEIGNGTADGNRSNMLTVQKNGNVKLGNMTNATDIIEEKLVVDGGVVIGENIDFEGFTGLNWETLTTNDDDPSNEIEIPTGGSDGDVLTTDGAGNYSWNPTRGIIPEGAIPFYGVKQIFDGETTPVTFYPYIGSQFTQVPPGKYVLIMEYSIAPQNILSTGNYYCSVGPYFNAGSTSSSYRKHVFSAQTQVNITGNIAPVLVVKPNYYLNVANSSASSGDVRISMSGFLVDDLNY